MALSDRALAVGGLLLRAFTLLLLVAALIIIVTDKIYGWSVGPADQPSFTFRDLHALRYVMSVAVIGCAYNMLVIPFAAILVAKEKRIGRTGATIFLVFTDVVFAVLIATGAAAGLGLVAEFQRLHLTYDDSDVDNFVGIGWNLVLFSKKDVDNFYTLVYTSCGLMLGAVVCMVATIMISVHALAY